MKKIICLVLLVLMLSILLCGCNETWGPGNYSWKHVHVSDGVNGYCATVTSWHDNERGIELHTTEFGDVFFSEGTYTLFNNAAQCPFCGD